MSAPDHVIAYHTTLRIERARVRYWRALASLCGVGDTPGTDDEVKAERNAARDELAAMGEKP